jgi:serine/threonine protein kinase
MAIAVLDYIEGCTVLQFVQRNWETITNDTFRDLLCQIAGALKALHHAGLIHRNLHPDAIVLQLPGTQSAIKKRTAGTARSSTAPTAGETASSKVRAGNRRTAAAKLLSEMITCYLGDYWFLHNPRTVSCESSLGRADWGSPMTVPPEAMLRQYARAANLGSSTVSPAEQTLSRIGQVVAARDAALRAQAGGGARQTVGGLRSSQGSSGYIDQITPKSDIYAFGICIYLWATNGIHRSLPLTSEGFVDLPAVKRNLPLKWKPWLHSLMDMCLQVRPENRATSKDVHTFLSSRFGK